MTTVAHYKTTSTTHHGTGGQRGNVYISYNSGAIPGYKVKVSVSVKSGTRRGSCSTSFTPHV